MDKKKDRSQDETEESRSTSSKKDELNDDELDFSGGVAVVAACTKCNQSPCVCSTVV